MGNFGKDTAEYMKSRGVVDTTTLTPGYGSGTALGLKDIRSRLGNWTGWMILVAGIFILIILACISVLFYYIRSEDDAKTFYDNHKHMIDSTSSIIIVVSALIIIGFTAYLIRQWKNLDKEDAVLTDMARLGLEKLEKKEIHNGLTDLIANRADLTPFQRAQLRENIGNTVMINNADLYKNYLADPNNAQRIREQFAAQAREQGANARQQQILADSRLGELQGQINRLSATNKQLQADNERLESTLSQNNDFDDMLSGAKQGVGSYEAPPVRLGGN